MLWYVLNALVGVLEIIQDILSPYLVKNKFWIRYIEYQLHVEKLTLERACHLVCIGRRGRGGLNGLYQWNLNLKPNGMRRFRGICQILDNVSP